MPRVYGASLAEQQRQGTGYAGPRIAQPRADGVRIDRHVQHGGPPPRPPVRTYPSRRLYNNGYYYYGPSYPAAYPYRAGIGLGFYYPAPRYRYVDRTFVWYGTSGGYGFGYPTGELRLDVEPRHAQVYVDGYYAGTVDDFDGFSQALALEEGPYTIEIVAPGYETLEFDVRIQSGRRISYEGELIPAR